MSAGTIANLPGSRNTVNMSIRRNHLLAEVRPGLQKRIVVRHTLFVDILVQRNQYLLFHTIAFLLIYTDSTSEDDIRIFTTGKHQIFLLCKLIAFRHGPVHFYSGFFLHLFPERHVFIVYGPSRVGQCHHIDRHWFFQWQLRDPGSFRLCRLLRSFLLFRSRRLFLSL